MGGCAAGSENPALLPGGRIIGRLGVRVTLNTPETLAGSHGTAGLFGRRREEPASRDVLAFGNVHGSGDRQRHPNLPSYVTG